MSDFYRLGSYCEKIGSGATPRGGRESYSPDGPIALIRSQNVLNDRFSRNGLAYISLEQARQLQNVEVKEGDVLLNITGDSVARACQVDADILPARVNQHVAVIRPKPDFIDPRFLRYFLVAPSMQAHMLALAAAGATRNALTKSMIEDFRVPALPIERQIAVASVLGVLDEKIYANRQMNETLEAMSRAVFKDWFIDFGPTRTKMERRSPYLASEIWSLFPDCLDDFGRPEGWICKPLDQLADFLNGLALQKYPAKEGGGIPVIKIAQLRSGSVKAADIASVDIPGEYIVDDGDVLFSWSGSLLHRVWTAGRGALNQHLFKVTSKDFPKWIFFYWIDKHMPSFRATAASKATTMGHIQRHHLTQAATIIGTPPVMKAADDWIGPLFNRQIANDLESRTLAAMRDFLLPRLVSGALRVKDAEAIIERTS